MQEHLAAEAPEDSRRVFGDAVEGADMNSDQESRVPSPPLCFYESPHLDGGTHLYALASQTYPRLFKTGSGRNPWERLQSEDRKHKGRLRLYLVGIWWNEGFLEHLARKHLSETPPAELDIQGTEYRMTNLNEIKEATESARLQHRALSARTHVPTRDDDAEVECKRRRMHLQVCREEFEFYKEKRDYDIEASKKELAVEEQRLALQQRQTSS